jgi:thiol-disulfide isomerase/thioredoxin
MTAKKLCTIYLTCQKVLPNFYQPLRLILSLEFSMKVLLSFLILGALTTSLYAQSGFDVSALGPRVVAYEGKSELEELAAESKVLIFFGATWCSTCRSFYNSVQRDLEDIPEDITIVFADYDRVSSLKRSYDVSRQHTFVLLDERGRKDKFWVGSNSLRSALRRVD